MLSGLAMLHFTKQFILNIASSPYKFKYHYFQTLPFVLFDCKFYILHFFYNFSIYFICDYDICKIYLYQNNILNYFMKRSSLFYFFRQCINEIFTNYSRNCFEIDNSL